jgi:Zn finger protein HypA/HybF involved in hydrogenase expression
MDYLQQLEDWVLPVWAMRDDLTEDVDEYGGLEDADEFEEDEQYAYCSNCDVEYIAATADLELCENCGSAWCERCMPGGSIWQDSDKEEKLRFQVATDPTEPPIDHNVSFNRFWDVYEMLLKCPHCSGPARNALPFRD